MKEFMHDHESEIKKVEGHLHTDEELACLGELFKVFGERSRIRILSALFESELCVFAISELLGMEQSAVSHQLKILKNARLVDSRRDGKTNVYFLADAHVRAIIDQGYEHIRENEDVCPCIIDNSDLK
jgi:ArsR family transcriptional regulator